MWYEMRFWIETGFNALKSAGWQRRKTRRIDPARAERRLAVPGNGGIFVNRPRAGGAALARVVRGDAADALDWQPRGGRQCAESESGRPQPSRERVSLWHGYAEPPFGKGQDAAARGYPNRGRLRWRA